MQRAGGSVAGVFDRLASGFDLLRQRVYGLHLLGITDRLAVKPVRRFSQSGVKRR
jgi:hypothetical protein